MKGRQLINQEELLPRSGEYVDVRGRNVIPHSMHTEIVGRESVDQDRVGMDVSHLLKNIHLQIRQDTD